MDEEEEEKQRRKDYAWFAKFIRKKGRRKRKNGEMNTPMHGDFFLT
jgi:hypothetical protein